MGSIMHGGGRLTRCMHVWGPSQKTTCYEYEHSWPTGYHWHLRCLKATVVGGMHESVVELQPNETCTTTCGIAQTSSRAACVIYRPSTTVCQCIATPPVIYLSAAAFNQREQANTIEDKNHGMAQHCLEASRCTLCTILINSDVTYKHSLQISNYGCNSENIEPSQRLHLQGLPPCWNLSRDKAFPKGCAVATH